MDVEVDDCPCIKDFLLLLWKKPTMNNDFFGKVTWGQKVKISPFHCLSKQNWGKARKTHFRTIEKQFFCLD